MEMERSLEIRSVDLRLLCRHATEQQQTSKPNLMNAVHMYSKCVSACLYFCVCANLSGCAFESVSTCVCVCVCVWMERRSGERGEERGMEMEQMDEGRSVKEDYGTSNHHRTHKISAPTLHQRLQSQCRAGII